MWTPARVPRFNEPFFANHIVLLQEKPFGSTSVTDDDDDVESEQSDTPANFDAEDVQNDDITRMTVSMTNCALSTLQQ